MRHGEVCPVWLAGLLESRWRRRVQDPERFLAPYAEAGLTVADLGCGPGFFTVAAARLVGPTGRVIAVDLQPEMLAIVARRAAEAGLSERVTGHPCQPAGWGQLGPVDLALAIYVVHEVPDPTAFFRQAHDALRPGGRLLLAEPKLHVGRRRWRHELEAALAQGFRPVGTPQLAGSHTALLERPTGQVAGSSGA